MKKVLIADDDERVRFFLQELLAPVGCEVLQAEDGEEALKLLRSEKPDLMLLDLAMPKMHGYEVCKKARSDSDPEIARVKIIVISAKSYPVDMRAAKEVGADMYLVKPFGLQEVRSAVSKLLETPL